MSEFPQIRTPKMQKPCLTLDCRPAPALAQPGAVLALAGRVWMRLVGAGVAALMGLGVIDAAHAQAERSPDAAALQAQAGRWVAARQGLSPAQIQIQAPDPRLRIPACAGGFSFDAPFGTAQTVRARCNEPAWQLFLRAQWEGSSDPETRGGPADRPADGHRVAVSAPSSALAPSPGGGASSSAAVAAPRRAVILSRATPRGALLSPASAEVALLPARDVDNLVLTDLQHLQQVEAVRDLPAGIPLRSTDIRPAVLVKQGQMVQLTVGQGSGFVVSVRLEALQDGRMGDRISLRNPESGRTVSGVVTGPNQAQGA